MSNLFADTFYRSFSSASYYPKDGRRVAAKRKGGRSIPIISESETLQVTGTRSELERFDIGIVKFKRAQQLDIRLTLVKPDFKQRDARQEEEDEYDFLSYIFPDKIPLIHDLLMTGTPEVQILRVEGSREMINFFNTLTERLIRQKNLEVSVIVTERKSVAVDSIVKNSLDQLEDTLDFIFTDDFSKSMPIVHNLIVGSA